MIALFAALLYAAPTPATAADEPVFTVNSTKDTVDINVGDGICADSKNNCTLRAAVMEANANSDEEIISVPAGTYKLKIAGLEDMSPATGDLDILGTVTIVGAGAGKTIIDGKNLNRIFDVLNVPVTLEAITLTKGAVSAAHGRGGCMLAEGVNAALTIIGVIFTQCGAQFGAALAVASGASLEMVDSGIQDNSIKQGAVYLFQSAPSEISRSTFTGNIGGEGSSGAIVAQTTEITILTSEFIGNSAEFGGGIYTYDSTVQIEHSTIRENSGESGGGARFDDSDVGISETWIDGNSATKHGGGMIFWGSTVTVEYSAVTSNSVFDPEQIATGGGFQLFDATLTLVSTTISGNSADGGGGLYAAASSTVLADFATIASNSAEDWGGGIYLEFGSTATLSGSILDGNSATSGPDCSGDGVTMNSSLISDDTNCTLTGASNLLDQPAQLGPLAWLYPGNTPLHVPAAGSPVLGGIAVCSVGTIDQRTSLRPSANCDIGSVHVDFRELLVNGNFEDGLTGWTLKQVGTNDKVKGKAAYTGLKGLLLKGGAGQKTVLQQKVAPLPLFESGDTVFAVTYIDSKDTPDMKATLVVAYTDGSSDKALMTFDSTLDYVSAESLPIGIDTAKTVKKIQFKLVDKSASGKRFIDYIGVLWRPADDVRGAGPLPPPAAPDGFRGGN